MFYYLSSPKSTSFTNTKSSESDIRQYAGHHNHRARRSGCVPHHRAWPHGIRYVFLAPTNLNSHNLLTNFVVVSVFDRSWWSRAPSSFCFLLFCAVWSIVMLIYLALVPLFFARLYHNLAALVILGLTTLFWFAGSIAMADHIGVPHCGGDTYCQSAQAAVAFGFFIWAIFTGLTILEFLGFSRSRGPGAHADSKPGRV